MSHGYTDESGAEWPYECKGELENTCHSLEHAEPAREGRYPYPHSLEGACGHYSPKLAYWCTLADDHHGPHEYLGTWQPLPRPIRRRDLLEWAVLATVALTAAYLFSQGVRFAIG